MTMARIIGSSFAALARGHRGVAIAMALIFLPLLLTNTPAQAQTVSTFSNTTAGAINGTTTCTAPLVRNFTVGASFTVSDVDIGILATHTWRGDMRMTLQSPAGTRVQIVNGDTNTTGNADNFNVQLSDEATGGVVNANNVNHNGTTAPPYQNSLTPNAALSAFDGQNSAGTWRLEICDLFSGADNGNFVRADLFLTQQPASFADLSLTKTVSNANPANASNVTYTLSVTNAGASTLTATGVQVRDILPAGTTFVSSTGDGSFDSATGIWTPSSIAPGQTRTRTIVVTVSATPGATIINSAEIIASSAPDSDSTVNNGITTEDDFARVNLTIAGTRIAGTPPTLVCPTGNTVIDWGSGGAVWTSGQTSNTYSVANIGNIGFAVTAPTGAGTVSTAAVQSGGAATAPTTLYYVYDFATNTDAAVTIISLPTAVPGMQFQIFDVDFGANSWADLITVTGTFNGAAVTPTVTNSLANFVIANQAFGDVSSGNTSSDGNITVTFTQPVDTVTITYSNHSAAPANPQVQVIAINDITFCNPQAALSVTKISSVLSDPVNGTTDPKAIPGATVQYCILISNAGSGTATNVSAVDSIPAGVTYVAGTMRSGSNCSSAATIEDDDNADVGEPDPVQASISGATITATATSIAPAASLALTFQAEID